MEQHRQGGYGAGDAAKLAGVPYRTLDYWSRSGFLEASLLEAAGKGSRRFYGFADVVSLRAAVKLRRFGVSLQALRKIQERLRTYRRLEHPLAEARLVVIPGERVDVARVEIAEDAARLESLLRDPGQMVAAAIVLDLGELVRDVQTRVASLAALRPARPRKSGARGKNATREGAGGGSTVAA
jgi:DNA-binding transcriptional MerR regulator